MIHRFLTDPIRQQLFKKKAIILLGARQTGKTTLAQELMREHKSEAIWLNCDEPQVRASLTDASFSRLESLVGPKKWVFIDEAQRVENIGLTLKILVDSFPEKQVFVTGSSSLDIANLINEPLTGRKFEHFLYPISYAEWAAHVGPLAARAGLDRMLQFGMYPDVLTSPGSEEPILLNLAGSYLYKDILAFRDVRKPVILEKLLRALALQLGNEVSLTELANVLQIDKNTVETYLNLLEKAFIVFRLSPFSRNLRSEITKLRKVYFWDIGIRNALISNFNPPEMRQDKGAIWENFLVVERLKHRRYAQQHANYYFWRTQQGQEIDFLEEHGGRLHGFEFKWSASKARKFPKPFLDNYPDASTQTISTANFEAFVGVV